MTVTSKASGTIIELRCCLCYERLALSQSWFAFPPDCDAEEGKWLHRRCCDGRIQDLWGNARIVMMRGDMALSHLTTSLKFTTDE